MAIPFQNYTFIGDKFGTGGINLKYADTNLGDNESPNCKNVVMTKRGAISSRQGYVKLNPTPVPAYPLCLGIYEYIKSTTGVPYVLSAWGTDIYTGVGVLAGLGLARNATAWDSFATLNDVVTIVNGVDGNIYFDGTNVFDLGIAAPAAAPNTAINVAVGNLNGAYYYVVTYLNAMGGESNPSPISAVVNPVNQQVDLTVIPVSADLQVVTKNIYRTWAGGTVYQYVDNIPNAQVAYTDNLADIDLGVEVDYDNDVPPIFRYVCTHKNKLFGVDATEHSRLWMSKDYQPGEVPLLNFIDIAKDDGDSITGIVSFFDQLVIFKNRAIYVLSGNTAEDISVQKSQSDVRIGCVSPRTLQVCDNFVLFLSERGIYAFDGLRTTYLSELIEPTFDKTNPNVTYRFNWTKQDVAVGLNYKNGSRTWYILAIPTGSSTYARFVWVFDYIQKIWFPFQNIDVDSMAIVAEQNEPRWYTGRTGFLWRQDDTDSDGWIHVPSYSTSDTNTNVTLEDLTQADVHSTATAFGASTLTDNTQAWVVNIHNTKQLYIRSGAGAGQHYTITSNTADTLSIAPVVFAPAIGIASEYTVGGWPVNMLDHVPVKIVDGPCKGQTRIIASNTSVDLTISVPWSFSATPPFTNGFPNTHSKYSVGYIEKEWDSRWFHYNAPEFMKRLNYVHVNSDREGSYFVRVGFRYDFFTGDINTDIQDLALTKYDSTWDISLWDVDSWDQVSKAVTRLSAAGNHIHRYVQIVFRNDNGNEPFTINSLDFVYQIKGIRR